MIILGSKDNVQKIMTKYGIELKQGTFAGDNGYLFEVAQNGRKTPAVVNELSECGDVIALSRMYEVISKKMQDENIVE